MSLKTAQKMFLVSPEQLNRLTHSDTSIRRTAEDDLDAKMRAVMNERGISSYEKIKRYGALLQRYLTFLKQDQKDERRLTVTLQPRPDTEESAGADAQEPPADEDRESDTDEVAEEVLKSLPTRGRKNVKYILEKLSKTDRVWNSKGEFVFRGSVIRGSHMVDLFKNLLLPSKKVGVPPPKGWNSFLNILSDLNIPQTAVTNARAREQYRCLRAGGERSEYETPEDRSVKKRKRKNILLSPHWSGQAEEEAEELGEEEKEEIASWSGRRGRTKGWISVSP